MCMRCSVSLDLLWLARSAGKIRAGRLSGGRLLFAPTAALRGQIHLLRISLDDDAAVSDRRQTREQALRDRSAPNDLAAAAYTYSGRAVVMRIARAGDKYVLLLDDGGLTIRRILFRDLAELEAILPSEADEFEHGFEGARLYLIQQLEARLAQD